MFFDGLKRNVELLLDRTSDLQSDKFWLDKRLCRLEAENIQLKDAVNRLMQSRSVETPTIQHTWQMCPKVWDGLHDKSEFASMGDVAEVDCSGCEYDKVASMLHRDKPAACWIASGRKAVP